MTTPIHTLGQRSIGLIQGLGSFSLFGSRILLCLFTPPFRPRRLLDECFEGGFMSLAIVCTSGAAVGMVMGLQSFNALSRFGAEESMGSLVGLTLVRELGPVLTALLVIGRAGSATAAGIGAMVATQQLDGLRMLSIDPIHYVAAPKAVALTLVMPLLSALFICFALAGGYVIGVPVLGVDGGSYLTSLESALDFSDDILGSLLKAFVFGILVGLIATYRGYTSEPNSEGVSRATTGAVVQASVATLVVDYVITALWGI
ncbi:MAG: ABC transporter permease [bacterium]|nr:ABC transporter permease [bacterium]